MSKTPNKCAKNPLCENLWFRTESHNNCRYSEMQARMIEQQIRLYGTTIFYYPVSEYSLDGLSAIWGEDPNKKYFEKYTLKATTDAENTMPQFNSFGATREESDRTIFVSKKMFTDITGNIEPRYGDHFLWTGNSVIYQIENFSDQDSITLGVKQWWSIYAIPRMVEGEVFGLNNCDGHRDEVIDPDPNDPDACLAESNKDGNVIDDPTIHVPAAQSRKGDDKEIIDHEQDKFFLRNSWGGWDK